jgi:hypothetical protein
VDPIDGTRGLMYQKRSGWILTGIAPYRGGAETLGDICLAVQTELPLVKQHLCAELAAIDDAVVSRVLGGGRDDGDPLVFDDEDLSSGGQLYELAIGHDRWTVDLPPLLQPARRAAGRAPIFCAHPYDLSCELIAREAGVIVTDPRGKRLAAPLDVTSDVAWVGFANADLARSVGAALTDELRARALI